MSFLFNRRRNVPSQGPPSAAPPPVSRNIHTSDGTSSSSPLSTEKLIERRAQSPPPNISGTNSSLTSVASLTTAPPSTAAPLPPPQNGQPGPNPPFAQRQRAGSELGARPSTANRPPHSDLYPWSQKTLSFSNPNANPFPRYGAAVNATASKDGDIYLMGGLINGDVVRGDLWMVEAGATGLSCYPIATVSEGPGPRVGHASLLVGNAFIVFGGDTKMADSDVLDDTLYLLNTTSRQWSRASPPGRRPSGRYGHTLNILGSKIYIFGGQVEGSFYNDLITFDLNALQNPSNQWDFLTPAGDGTNVPSPRTNHTMISHNDCLYLFGGTDGTTWYNDVWVFEPKSNAWTQQDCIGYIPAPREGHSAAIVNDVMYIFGGRTEQGEDLGDLAAFRTSLRRWYTFQNMGPAPSPRSGHSMTAYGKQIIVLAGEPSTAPRDPAELSLTYVLDTAKIRYPNDGPANSQKAAAPPPALADRSNDASKSLNNPARSASREGTNSRNDNSPQGGISGGPVQKPEPQSLRIPPAPASISSSTESPVQDQRGPPPRTNGTPPAFDQKGIPNLAAGDAIARHFGGNETMRQAPPGDNVNLVRPPPVRGDSRDGRANRGESPNSQGRRTPGTGSISKARNMEAGEAAPLVGTSMARQRSLRSQRGQSFEGSEDGNTMRSAAARAQLDHNRHSKTFAEEPLGNAAPRQEALVRELEAIKSKNAWYASELALARKSGYTAASSPTLDDRSAMNFGDDDRPLMEAFMAMRNELVKMQQNMELQATTTARKIAEVEHQRDAAVTEAAYARAKLAAHGGSQRSTPQLDSSRDIDDTERHRDLTSRLALSLAAANEHKARLDTMQRDLEAERRAREAAEEAAEATQARFDDLNSNRSPHELGALRAELHDTQSFARAESAQRAELEQKLRMLELDHKELDVKHRDVSEQMSNHISSLSALEAAVAASSSKSAMYERQLHEERQEREALQSQLTELRAEHEDRTRNLESTTRQLRDVQELADNHAKEAATHREALMTGLAKLSRPESAMSRGVAGNDERVAALQDAVEKAKQLAKSNAEAAEVATQKLRGAEERIAGLEAYQEQSSREGVNARRQMQAAIRDTRQHESDNRELRQQIETHQRNASALTVQYSALKNLLTERGIDTTTMRRSPVDASRSLNGTPDVNRTAELEQLLRQSQTAHEETKSMFESREQEAEKAYRERLEQLENDYKSLLTYVKGTDRLVNKMKQELARYKNVNQRLSSELEASRDGKRSVGSTSTDPVDWAEQREVMQSAINDLRSQMNSQIESFETDMASVRSDLSRAQTERDQQRISYEKLTLSLQQRERDLSELKNENSMLETRALDAEHKVMTLLDQVESSVNTYRRQSTRLSHNQPNGLVSAHSQHNRMLSTSTATDISSHSDHEPSSPSAGGDNDTRGSLALDNLASELETLKAQWESQTRSYRLSDRFDFERTPTRTTATQPEETELADSLKQWRTENRQSGVAIDDTAEHGKLPTVSHTNQPTTTTTTTNNNSTAPAVTAARAAAAVVQH